MKTWKVWTRLSCLNLDSAYLYSAVPGSAALGTTLLDITMSLHDLYTRTVTCATLPATPHSMLPSTSMTTVQQDIQPILLLSITSTLRISDQDSSACMVRMLLPFALVCQSASKLFTSRQFPSGEPPQPHIDCLRHLQTMACRPSHP